MRFITFVLENILFFVLTSRAARLDRQILDVQDRIREAEEERQPTSWLSNFYNGIERPSYEDMRELRDELFNLQLQRTNVEMELAELEPL